MNRQYNQALANLSDLLKEPQYAERKECLFKILEIFQKCKINYSIICSLNLFIRGIIDDFYDFDILIEYEEAKKVKSILEAQGAILVATGGNGYCESRKYMNFKWGRVDIDIIADFRLVTFESEYIYVYNENENDKVTIGNLETKLASLEALYVLYYMMEGWQPRRKYKRLLIEKALLKNTISYKGVLKKALEEFSLPEHIQKGIRKMLNE